jgi:hypothetical protein
MQANQLQFLHGFALDVVYKMLYSITLFDGGSRSLADPHAQIPVVDKSRNNSAQGNSISCWKQESVLPVDNHLFGAAGVTCNDCYSQRQSLEQHDAERFCPQGRDDQDLPPLLHGLNSCRVVHLAKKAHPIGNPGLFGLFWSGLNKLEDLDMIRPGEIGHVHFQDVPDIPRELLDLSTRIIPGDGISPLTRILGKLSEKGYAGPLSVELFMPKFQQGDPYEVAREICVKFEAIMRQAGVG